MPFSAFTWCFLLKKRHTSKRRICVTFGAFPKRAITREQLCVFEARVPADLRVRPFLCGVPLQRNEGLLPVSEMSEPEGVDRYSGRQR